MDSVLALRRATPAPAAEAPRGAHRLLYVINSLALGGAEKALLHQATRLDRSRYVPQVASLELPPRGELTPLFAEVGIPIHPLRRPGEPLGVGWPRLLALIDRRRPEIVHTHLVAAGIVGRLAARMKRVPATISTLHNVSDWEERRWYPLRWLDRRTLPLADRIIAVSDATRRGLARVSPALAPRTRTVHNGVALPALPVTDSDRATARSELGYRPDDLVVGAVARLTPQKGLDILIEATAIAAQGLPQLRLLFVGDGPDRTRLENLVHAHRLGNRTRFAGRQVQVGPFLAAMNVFAAPSRTEGLGVALIEALAAGLPVLGATVGGIPEVIEDGISGHLITRNDPATWAETLVNLGNRPQHLRALATAAPASARRFDLEEHVRALASVYDQALELATVPREIAA
jgi:glycosyltransferase involved in cell wall biosynthesis